MSDKEELELIKESLHKNPKESLSNSQLDWLINKVSILIKVKDLCKQQSTAYAKVKNDTDSEKTNSFYNGKQKGFENITDYIEKLENMK